MNSGGRDHQEVGVGNSEGRSGRLATAGDTSTEPSSLMLFVSRQEPPYTEPYVRWCGRTAGATPPPTRLCFPHDTRGSRTFCVCDQTPVAWQEHPRLPSVPPSLLSKSALTSSPWHTHMAFCDHHLRACHCHSLSGGLGAAVRHANTAAAQGMEYKPARCCVTTSAP